MICIAAVTCVCCACAPRCGQEQFHRILCARLVDASCPLSHHRFHSEFVSANKWSAGHSFHSCCGLASLFIVRCLSTATAGTNFSPGPPPPPSSHPHSLSPLAHHCCCKPSQCSMKGIVTGRTIRQVADNLACKLQATPDACQHPSAECRPPPRHEDAHLWDHRLYKERYAAKLEDACPERKYPYFDWIAVISFPFFFAASFGEFGSECWRTWGLKFQLEGVNARSCVLHSLDLFAGVEP